jgi:hypothetical protein
MIPTIPESDIFLMENAKFSRMSMSAEVKPKVRPNIASTLSWQVRKAHFSLCITAERILWSYIFDILRGGREAEREYSSGTICLMMLDSISRSDIHSYEVSTAPEILRDIAL